MEEKIALCKNTLTGAYSAFGNQGAFLKNAELAPLDPRKTFGYALTDRYKFLRPEIILSKL